MQGVRWLESGEQGMVVEFGDAIDPALNARVHRLAAQLQRAQIAGVLETVPTYRSLLVIFDPLVLSRRALQQRICELLAQPHAELSPVPHRVVTVPVCYGGEFGPDIAFVAAHNQLSEEEVIAAHSAGVYRVYMLGFTPGFAYLGGMSQRLATPRLATPRVKIPAGSVGIAGAQTGIYPIESPGGWQLIGRTPLRLFDAQAQHPFLFAAGDELRFVRVSREEYGRIAAQVARGAYTPIIESAVGGHVEP